MALYLGSNAHVFNTAALDAITSKLMARESEVEDALARAVNTAAEKTIELTEEEWNSYFRINGGYINGKVRLVRRARAGRTEAVVGARARATRADNFKFRVLPNRKGVRLNVRRGGSGGVIRNAFVIPRAKSNGQPLILERLQKYQKGERRDFRHGSKQIGRFNRAEKLRFKALYGPSVNQHFHDSRARVAPIAMTAAKEQFMKAIRA
ncbi:hypothetical protein [Marinobacterium stanieri]|uniref:hypothetical protein n=1 Tax=Marinobacterium stanieri TaxID=49186 RepID=UPI0002558F13|nr:hypothetical protein [Marinobacterium stanieri]